MKEFFQLAAFWLLTKELILQSELPKGWDLAGCMLGMRDAEQEMKLVLEEMRDGISRN